MNTTLVVLFITIQDGAIAKKEYTQHKESRSEASCASIVHQLQEDNDYRYRKINNEFLESGIYSTNMLACVSKEGLDSLKLYFTERPKDK